MTYQNQKILLVASENAFKSGQLSKSQFLKILEDIESDLIKSDKKLLGEDISKILEEYANS